MQWDIMTFKTSFWDVLRQIMGRGERMFQSVYERYGLTGVQLRLLMDIRHARGGVLSVGALSESTCMAGANVSSMCKKMERAGLVVRARSMQDERVVNVSLTEHAQDVLSQIKDEMYLRFEPVGAQMSEQDMEDIVRGLNRLNEMVKLMSQQFTYTKQK